MVCTVGEIICPLLSGSWNSLKRAIIDSDVSWKHVPEIKYLDIPFINSNIRSYLYEEVTGGCA